MAIPRTGSSPHRTAEPRAPQRTLHNPPSRLPGTPTPTAHEPAVVIEQGPSARPACEAPRQRSGEELAAMTRTRLATPDHRVSDHMQHQIDEQTEEGRELVEHGVAHLAVEGLEHGLEYAAGAAMTNAALAGVAAPAGAVVLGGAATFVAAGGTILAAGLPAYLTARDVVRNLQGETPPTQDLQQRVRAQETAAAQATRGAQLGDLEARSRRGSADALTGRAPSAPQDRAYLVGYQDARTAMNRSGCAPQTPPGPATPSPAAGAQRLPAFVPLNQADPRGEVF